MMGKNGKDYGWGKIGLGLEVGKVNGLKKWEGLSVGLNWGWLRMGRGKRE